MVKDNIKEQVKVLYDYVSQDTFNPAIVLEMLKDIKHYTESNIVAKEHFENYISKKYKHN